ncbi:sigma-70 family RNA polymerase sigma factor [Myceligenerans pegani]|uniref:Sigma-70 family RNA polymerase sigma factor n=1 Tax=Myceligenerans pegani TaxID=2776917 RepID=A0ABR9N3S4_9MICO|nr:sigma-70 family RNA polymerase sigma factor [Myceligenerans sp. TRM 65318]MBE1877916.1 sigma-70 family RNA polymerase sigma factor [Myceligenerans sp. TRM 65318]MBE3020187.1 sigma-70 family RNA polymerase sigma factor [Myceligenerans sp. TRM 65318]
MTSSTRSDETLLADLRAGRDHAFAELYVRHRRAAVGVARRVVGKSHAVDDVVAESFTSFLSVVRDGGGPSGNVRSYLLTTVRNTAIRFRHAQERAVPAEAEIVDGPHHDADGLVAADDVQRIRQAFAALPPRWRRVLWYVDVHDLPPAQAGPLLGVSPNATSSLARRARERLRREYLQAHRGRVAPGCEDYAPHLARYVEESLAAPVHHRVEVHVLTCLSCATAVEQMRDLRRRMRAVLLPLGLPLAAGGRADMSWAADHGPKRGTGVPGAGARGLRAFGRRWWWSRPSDLRRVVRHGATVAVVCLLTLPAVAASDGTRANWVEGVAEGADLTPGFRPVRPPEPMSPPGGEPRPEPTSAPTPSSEPTSDPAPELTPDPAQDPAPAPTSVAMPAPTPAPAPAPPSSPAPPRDPEPPPSASTPAPPAPEPEPDPAPPGRTPEPPSDPTPSPTPDPTEPPLLEIVIDGEPVIRVP